VKISSPDVRSDPSLSCGAFLILPYLVKYRSWDPDLAVQDYYNRIRGHEKHYETVDELDVPSIRIINVCPYTAVHMIVVQLTAREP
jgi:hypothetical protein